MRKSGTQLAVQGRLRGTPRSRFTVEVFGNRDKGGAEGEIFLGEAMATTDADGGGIFALTVDAPAALPASFTATVTSSEGATSELSAPVALSE